MKNPGRFYTEYYPQVSNVFSDSLSNEIMVLQKSVILPYVNEEYSCDQLMAAYKEAECEYRTADEWYTDVLANFYPLMLAPMVKDGESTMLIHDAPDVSGIITVGEGEFATTEYKEQNYIELTIPKSLVLTFRKEIPKGTKFSCTFIGGSAMYRSIKLANVVELGKEYIYEPIDEEGHIFKYLTWEECVAAAGGEDMVPFWLMDRVEKRIEDYNMALEKVETIIEGVVEQQKEVRGKAGEIMYT